jgi:hypothetical protein
MPFHFVYVSLFILAPIEVPSTLLGLIQDEPPNQEMSNFYTKVSIVGNSWLPFSCEFKGRPQIQQGRYILSVLEEDWICQHAMIGPAIGLNTQWYFGHGFASTLALGFPELQTAISIDWYPFEGIGLSLGLDLLRRQVRLDWELEKPEDLLPVVGLVYFTYWLNYWIESQR